MESISAVKTQKGWGETIQSFLHPRVLTMLFLGFSAGVPILLIFSSLSLWLREAGVERSAVTYFSWAALGYSFKFVWAPLVDKLPLPILTALLGRRRSWMLFSQVAIIGAIFWMAQTDPTGEGSMTMMAFAAVLLGFSSATQDVVIDAYRIESADSDLQALMSSTYIAGYRIGMLVAGAGALYLASYFGSDKGSYNYQAWQISYSIMAIVMLIGIITTLIIPEPEKFKTMSKQLSVGYILVILILLLSINELTATLIVSKSQYYYWFTWLFRALFGILALQLVIKKIRMNNETKAHLNIVSSNMDKVAFFILGLAFCGFLASKYQIDFHLEIGGIIYNFGNYFYWVIIILLNFIFIAIYIRQRVSTLVEEKKAEYLEYSTKEYLGLLLLFIVAVAGFIATFYYSVDIAKSAKATFLKFFSNEHLAGFIVQFLRLLTALSVAGGIATLLTRLGFINKKMVISTYVEPVKDFFSRYGMSLALLLLALIGLYRISDIVLGVISNVFYQDLGYSKIEIASVVKTFGLFMTIAGGFLGGLLSVRFGVMKILFLGALLSAVTNLLFLLLAQTGYSMPMLYLVISADNISAGLASAAFIAFLSQLTNITFTAVQYAIFSSLMTLLPKILGGYSGTMVDGMGYSNFFLITALMGTPVLILIILAGKYLVKE